MIKRNILIYDPYLPYGDKMYEEDASMPFKLGTEEIVVKDYNAVIMKLPQKMEGHIIITNKRAILYSFTNSMLKLAKENFLNDVHLDEVKGITAYIGSKRSLANIIIGIFMFLFGLIMIFVGIRISQSYYIDTSPGFFILLGIIFIIVSIILMVWRTKSIYVHIKAARVPGIEIGATRKGPIQIMGTKPGPDADRMVYEISAVIADLQKQQGVKEIDEL